jgi:PAS domain S-box-containing protein
MRVRWDFPLQREQRADKDPTRARADATACLPLRAAVPATVGVATATTYRVAAVGIDRSEHAHALIANAPDAILELDREARVLFANAAAHELAPELRVGESWPLALPVQAREAAERAFAAALLGERNACEVLRVLPDGGRTYAAYRLAPLHLDEQIAGVVVMGRDVTTNKQEELRRLIRDRLSALGTFAATVSHEINNPLAALLMGLDLIVRDIDVRRSNKSAAEFREELGDMREAANRTRQVVRDLRIFARPEDEAIARVDVRSALASAARLVRTDIRQRARLIESYNEVPTVDANEAKLGQLFLNVMLNAAQAIEERGEDNEVRIETSVDPRGQVVVTIADTGRGIDPELQPRLFEPFFTTRPGASSGIGLSICSQIVESMGGAIAFESEPGKGTVFRITLPAAARQPSPVPPNRVERRVPRRGRILVIDDESMVVSVVARFLADVHDVVPALDARTGLELLLRDPSFDVILCDLMMPHMTGMELYATLREANPALARRMVFMTAGAFTPRAREFLESVPNARLEKPFDPATLRALLDQLVQG